MDRKRLQGAVLIRVLFDVVALNFALVTAFVLWFLFLAPDMGSDTLVAALGEAAAVLPIPAATITVIAFLAFWFSGFYSFGRVYRRGYKAWVIARAVILSYLGYSALAYLISFVPALPRWVFGLAFLLTLLLVGGMRFLLALPGAFSARGGRQPQKRGDVESVLVIGGAGYIGSALVKKLLELGYRVRVLDLLLYGEEPIAEFYDHPRFELIRGDFRHIHTVVSAVRDMDAIVHLGAIVGDSACSIDEDVTVEINLRATQTIAEVGKGFGIRRFIFASTCSVYGASDELLDECSVLRPISLYARTKMESEKVLLSLADSDFAPTILRFGTIYGLSGRPRFDLVVNLLTAKAIQDGEAGIFGGTQWRPFVHVQDVAEAIVLALQVPDPAVRAQVFNVGSNEQNYQISELGSVIKEMVPSARVVTQPQEDERNYRVRFDRIHNALKFQPHHTVPQGVQEILDAFATGKITDYRDPRFHNFNFLSQNGNLRSLLIEDVGSSDWVKLSAIDAMMLTEVIMAAIDSGSPELMNRLREAMVQVILGDEDGFLEILAGVHWASSGGQSQRTDGMPGRLQAEVELATEREPARAESMPLPA